MRRTIAPMNPKLKTALIVLGTLAALLIISQLTMGLYIVRGQAGHPLPGNYPLPKLVKMHQHSGYLTVTVALIYVVASLRAIATTPGRPRA